MAARSALRFARHQGGATAIEYGLIVALMALVIVGALQTFSSVTGGKYDFIREQVDGAIGGGDGGDEG